MPTFASETAIDAATLQKAVAWAIRYFFDPKRGNNKNLPTSKEIQKIFPQVVSIEQVENWIRNTTGIKEIDRALNNRQEVEKILQRVEGQETQSQQLDAKVPQRAPSSVQDAKVPSYSKGKTSAMGVLAELEEIEPFLRKNRQETEVKLSQSLNPKVNSVLSSLGIKIENKQTLAEIVGEISRETARQTLDEAVQIQLPGDTAVTVADSLSQTLLTHPQIGKEIKLDEENLVKKVIPQIQEVVGQNQNALEQAAVLASVAQIASLNPNTPQAKDLISQDIEQAAEQDAPLLDPQSKEILKTNMAVSYLSAYKETFFNNLKIGTDSTPTLEQLQQSKQKAHENATKDQGSAFSATQTGKKIAGKITYPKLTSAVAQTFNLVGPTPTIPPKLPLIARVILSDPNRYKDLYLTALAHDEQYLAKALKENSQIIEELKKKRSLSYKEVKALKIAQQNYARYAVAQALKVKKPKQYSKNLSFLSKTYAGRPEVASSQIWQSEYYTQKYLPKMFASNIRLSAGAAWGKLGFNIAGMNIGSIFSNIKAEIGATSLMAGMGVTRNPVTGLLQKARNIAGLTFGGVFLYFMHLGQAALAGFIAGAAVGGIAGAAVGFLAPPILWPITVPLGFFAGGTVGGIAGGLIGYGLGSSTTTAVTAGIGAGVGGVAGGVLGGILGSALGPIGTIVGAAIGAYVGAAIGGSIGYLIGNYVLPAFKGLFDGILGGAQAGIGASGGFFGALGGFAANTLSAIGGALGSAASGAFGMFTGIGNFLVGSLGSISIPTSFIAIPVFGGVGSVLTIGLVTTITTAASFSSIENELNNPIPGQNEFFTLTKTTPQSHFDNPPPTRDVKFTITLTAKDVKLTNISIDDKIEVTPRNIPAFEATHGPLDPGPCPTELEPGQNCTYSYIVSATEPDFIDSVVSNMATATVTPEGQSLQTESVTEVVTIGNPPAQCPRKWPTGPGWVSQGPEGATSHSSPSFGEYEALDLAVNLGTPVYATVEGTVIQVYSKDGNPIDQRIVVKPTSCSSELKTVQYWHLSKVLVSQNQIIKFGDKIAEGGAWAGDPTAYHIHYEFNEPGNRDFKIQPPYVPVNIPRKCDGYEECGKVDIAPL